MHVSFKEVIDALPGQIFLNSLRIIPIPWTSHTLCIPAQKYLVALRQYQQATLKRAGHIKAALRCRSEDSARLLVQQSWGRCATANTIWTLIQQIGVRRDAWGALSHERLAATLVRWSKLVVVKDRGDVLDESRQVLRSYAEDVTASLKGLGSGAGSGLSNGYIGALCKSALAREAKAFLRKSGTSGPQVNERCTCTNDLLEETRRRIVLRK